MVFACTGPLQAGRHGFVYTDGTFTELDVPFPDAHEIFASGINNAGQVVGYFINSTGNHVGFLATPVPEPSTWLLLGSGLVALAFARRKLAV